MLSTSVEGSRTTAAKKTKPSLRSSKIKLKCIRSWTRKGRKPFADEMSIQVGVLKHHHRLYGYPTRGGSPAVQAGSRTRHVDFRLTLTPKPKRSCHISSLCLLPNSPGKSVAPDAKWIFFSPNEYVSVEDR